MLGSLGTTAIVVVVLTLFFVTLMWRYAADLRDGGGVTGRAARGPAPRREGSGHQDPGAPPAIG
jgi:hypothetical protein